MVGSFSWNWQMGEAPELPNEGLRGRLDEAVQLKYFARFAEAAP